MLENEIATTQSFLLDNKTSVTIELGMLFGTILFKAKPKSESALMQQSLTASEVQSETNQDKDAVY